MPIGGEEGRIEPSKKVSCRGVVGLTTTSETDLGAGASFAEKKFGHRSHHATGGGDKAAKRGPANREGILLKKETPQGGIEPFTAQLNRSHWTQKREKDK